MSSRSLKGENILNEMQETLVSIIVPVYNVQAYIERCFDSILKQTYSNFEVICVDDGSKDDSGKLCDVYQERDSRIRVYHNDNHGVSYARNYGLNRMHGEWFCFVDPDDWIEPNYLERMYELAKEKKCEVVACGVDTTYQFCMGIKNCEEEIHTFASSDGCIRNFICSGNSMHGISCNKLFNARKFGGIRFDETVKVNEDCLYIYQIMSVCERACLTTLPLYHWYLRPDSACHKRAKKADFRAAEVFLQLYDKLTGIDMDEARTVLRYNYITSVVQVLLFAKYEKGNAEVTLAKRRCKEWKKDVWNRFDVKQKLKYWYAIYVRSLWIRD